MALQIGQHIASEDATQKFIKILENNGIFEQVKSVVITETPELKGEHMATATVYAKIEFKNPSVKPKNLFIKKYTDNEDHTAWVKEMKLMEKEATFYNDFLPALREFTGKFDGCENLLPFFANVLHADDERIILENLILDDTFLMLSKDEKLDLHTAKYVLSNLAKFHAASFAYVQAMGEDEFRNKWGLVCAEALLANEKNPMLIAIIENSVAACINILKGNPVEGDQEVLSELNSYIGKGFSRVSESTKPGNTKFLVVNHGDCWINNMLFKSTNGKVTDHIFVDFQITRHASPNVDLSFFFFTSIKPGLRREHFKDLMKHYYDTLVSTAAMLKQTIPITFDEFLDDYKKKMDYGFYFGLCMVSAIGAMKDIDMDKMNNDADDMMAMFKTAIDNWIKNNPEKAAELSKEIVAVVREYKDLSL